MKPLLLGLFILISSGIAALVLFFLWASSGRYPVDRYAHQVTRDDYPLKTEAEEVTVVSYNIGYLSGLTNNQAVSRSRQLYDKNLATAIASLQSVNPDLVALQEVDLGSKRSFNVDQVAEISQAIESPQQAIAINWDKRYVPFPSWPPSAHFGAILSGQAILSRFPVTRHERLVLEKVPSNPFYYNALYLDRLAQVAEVAIGDRTLIVINIHLEAFDGSTRLNQTTFVRQLAEDYAKQHPVLLVGDFNSALNRDLEGEPRSIQTMLESPVFSPAIPADQFTDAAQFTYPADTPQYKLDYIFYTPQTLELLEVSVLAAAAQASDHLPLIMRLRLR
ncbi:MAG: endonuclease/exonuclease/phosphatase family protein [Leptolyngbya sp. SIO1E4]|nr:endonuclease/exonuclease/phosphatase family protein [Leptolyngbya sp. SIO1E4]